MPSLEIIKEEAQRSKISKLIEFLVCRFIGHNRHFSVWAGRYNPRHCYRCNKHISLW